jgi:hypothetical protein
VGHPLAVEGQPVAEPLGLDQNGTGTGAAGRGAAGDRHPGFEEMQRVDAQGGMGLNKLGQGDAALEGVTDE